MRLVWDQPGTRLFETGVDRGVLYIPDAGGAYTDGVPWNGLTTVTEKPTGADANPKYADNIKYLNLYSVEEFGATIEAMTYPSEFNEFDGFSEPVSGVALGQQSRRFFGLGYRSLIGNDIQGNDFGTKLHLVYGCMCSPSEKAYASVNDSPDAIAFSWDLTTQPVAVGNIGGVDYKPTSLITVDSTKVDAAAFAALQDVLYGTPGVDPRLPLPAEVIALFSGTITTLAPAAVTAPTYNNTTHTITIPATTGVTYYINGVPQATGPVVITEDTVVTAEPNAGYEFAAGVDNDWGFDYS